MDLEQTAYPNKMNFSWHLPQSSKNQSTLHSDFSAQQLDYFSNSTNKTRFIVHTDLHFISISFIAQIKKAHLLIANLPLKEKNDNAILLSIDFY